VQAAPERVRARRALLALEGRSGAQQELDAPGRQEPDAGPVGAAGRAWRRLPGRRAAHAAATEVPAKSGRQGLAPSPLHPLRSYSTL